MKWSLDWLDGWRRLSLIHLSQRHPIEGIESNHRIYTSTGNSKRIHPSWGMNIIVSLNYNIRDTAMMVSWWCPSGLEMWWGEGDKVKISWAETRHLQRCLHHWPDHWGESTFPHSFDWSLNVWFSEMRYIGLLTLHTVDVYLVSLKTCPNKLPVQVLYRLRLKFLFC